MHTNIYRFALTLWFQLKGHRHSLAPFSFSLVLPLSSGLLRVTPYTRSRVAPQAVSAAGPTYTAHPRDRDIDVDGVSLESSFRHQLLA